MNIFNLLQQLHFNHHESKIYMLLLEMGCKPASVIAKKCNTPRSTIRNILDKLCEKKVIAKTLKGNTQYYYCKPPIALIENIQQKIQRDTQAMNNIQNVLHLFESLWEKKSFVPNVRTYEGEKGFIEAYNHVLSHDVPEILAITSYSFMNSERLRRNDLEYFMTQRIKKGIPLRVLSNKNMESLELYKTSKKHLRSHMFVPDGYEFPGTFHIYGNYIALLSSKKEESLGVIIESNVISDMMKLFFDYMWTTSKK